MRLSEQPVMNYRERDPMSQVENPKIVAKNVDTRIKVDEFDEEGSTGELYPSLSFRVICNCGNELSITSNEPIVNCDDCSKDWRMYI